MIWFVVGGALVLLLSWGQVFDQDMNMYTRASEKLKWTCQNASNDGAMYYNLIEYSNGKLVFDYSSGLKAIDKSVRDSLSLDASLSAPDDSYWGGDIKLDIYFYDDSLSMKHYSGDVLIDTKAFTFPTSYLDNSNGFSTEIFKPTVVVKVTAPDRNFRVGSSNPIGLSRTASAELVER